MSSTNPYAYIESKDLSTIEAAALIKIFAINKDYIVVNIALKIIVIDLNNLATAKYTLTAINTLTDFSKMFFF